jgi:hypothetical protein
MFPFSFFTIHQHVVLLMFVVVVASFVDFYCCPSSLHICFLLLAVDP